MAKISVRIEDHLLAELRAIAAKRNLDLSDVFRDAIRAYLLPARPETSPVLQVIDTAVQKEAASRGLSPAMIIELLFRMTRPTLPPEALPGSLMDGLRLNIKADEPSEPR